MGSFHGRWGILKKAYFYAFSFILYRLPLALRYHLFAGQSHFCPICERNIWRFLQFGRSYQALCPICQSERRHRLVWLFLAQHTTLFDKQPRRMLHFAPEAALEPRLRQIVKHYLTADRFGVGVSLKMDIAAIPLPDHSCDVIYCSHVLEHVANDWQALTELHRILDPAGYAIIMVPITTPTTFEDSSVTNPAERERLFGQHDHVRRYGPDFKERLEKCGFTVEVFYASQIVGSETERFGVSDKDPLFFCRRFR